MLLNNDEVYLSSTARQVMNWREIAFALIPVAAATIFFFPVIFQGKTFFAFDILLNFSPWAKPGAALRAHNPLISDPVNIFYPHYHYLKSSISEGVFPLWYVANFCGMPYGPPSNPLVYALYLLFPMVYAHDLLLWLNLLGAGLFMHFYLREIGLCPVASVIGSSSWMFNGYVMVWFEFENVLMMAACFPLILLLLERWFRTKTKTAYVLLIGAIAFSICVNYAHLLIYQLIFLCAYCLYRFFRKPVNGQATKRLGWREAGKLGVAILSAVCISASFFTTHLSYLEDPQRTQSSFETLFNSIGRLPLRYLVTLVFPDFYGNPVLPFCFTPGNQAYTNYNELCLYGGIPVLLLALACVPHVRERFVGFFFLTLLITVSMATGSILYYPFAAFVPGLNMSTPTRILYVFGFSFSVLAGLGCQAMLAKNDPRKWWGVALWISVLIFGIGMVVFVQTTRGLEWTTSHVRVNDPERFFSYLRDFFHFFSPTVLKPLLLLLVSVFIMCAFVFSRRMIFMVFLLVVLLYDLMSFGWVYNTASPRQLEYPETGGIRFLQKDTAPFRVATYGNILHNALAPFGIQDIGGYSSFYPKRYGDFLHLIRNRSESPPPSQHSRWVFFNSFGSPLLDLINTKYLVMSNDVSVQSDKVELVYQDEISIYRNKDAFPRAFFVHEFLLVENKEDAYRTMAGFTREDFRKKVILESEPPAQENVEGVERGDSQIRIVNYQSNRIDLDVSSPRDGFVVINDNYHPGWKAYVGSKEVPVIRANYIMRAIPVEKGDHGLKLIFRPKLIISGIIISALGWSLFFLQVGAIVFSRLRGKRGGAE